tara:strand:+ start:14242 stop:15282 length:1041 start_codon:yes stop_codon:yes gene_type:complete
MRYVVPVTHGRGAGLGNELILWAKAFLISRSLGARLLHPAWGLNQRRYWQYFGTSRMDYPINFLLRKALPTIRFTESDYLRCGGKDFLDSFKRFSKEQNIAERAIYAFEVDGLWGGPGMLGPAKDFIKSQLYNTRWTQDNIFLLNRNVEESRLKIGVHIRLGDFNAPVNPECYAGKFNTALPLDWYMGVMESIHDHFGGDAIFVITSDASDSDIRPLLEKFPCITTNGFDHADVSDLLTLAACDFLICSVSSFSMWAAFLGEMPYAWFEPQLSEHGGVRSIWGNQISEQHPNSFTSQARAKAVGNQAGRGVSLGFGDKLPRNILSHLENVLRLKQRETDLVRYGVL